MFFAFRPENRASPVAESPKLVEPKLVEPNWVIGPLMTSIDFKNPVDVHGNNRCVDNQRLDGLNFHLMFEHKAGNQPFSEACLVTWKEVVARSSAAPMFCSPRVWR